jgi:serine protease AprX
VGGLSSAPSLPVSGAASAYDRDGNRIFDDLDRVLAAAAPSAVNDVIVVFGDADLQEGLAAARASLGPFEPTFTFPTLPGFAAKLRTPDVYRLARVSAVLQIEPDAAAVPELDTSKEYVGVNAVRAAWNLTGDLDGDPSTFTRDDVVIAIIDTGIDVGHVDLAGGKVLAWFDAATGSATPFDFHGHGTRMASIAAGRGLGDPERQGMAPGAALVGARADSKSQAAAAVEWILAQRQALNIRILTISMGFGTGADGSDSLSRLYDAAFDAGILTVKSAGNSGPNFGTITIPGDAHRVLAVGNVEDHGKTGWKLYPTSSRGPTTDGRVKPDLVAPGTGIRAAAVGTGNGYSTGTGTSPAAPHVAGIAALVMSANTALSNVDIRRILVETAADHGWVGADRDYGHGLVDAYAAVARAQNLSGRNPAVMPDIQLILGSLAEARSWDLNVTGTAHALSLTILTNSTNPAINQYRLIIQPPGGLAASSVHVNEGPRHRVATLEPVVGTYRLTFIGSGVDVPFLLVASGDFATRDP